MVCSVLPPGLWVWFSPPWPLPIRWLPLAAVRFAPPLSLALKFLRHLLSRSLVPWNLVGGGLCDSLPGKGASFAFVRVGSTFSSGPKLAIGTGEEEKPTLWRKMLLFNQQVCSSFRRCLCYIPRLTIPSAGRSPCHSESASPLLQGGWKLIKDSCAEIAV